MNGSDTLPDFNRIWAAHVAASPSPRMHDDGIERAFWRDFISRKVYKPESSARQVLAYLRPLLREHQIETALEFGPGWGSYTLDLAALCREVACVDLSQDVLDFVLRAGRERGFCNLRAFHSKWEDFSPERTYDLVFGYNCFYRQGDLADCFARMTRTANKLCVAGMNVAVLPPWLQEMKDVGASANWDWKDPVYFVGVLHQMGLSPNLRTLAFRKQVVYPDVDTMVQGECANCAPGTIDPDIARDILCRQFSQASDGSWHAEILCRSGVVWWVPSVSDV